MGWQSDSGGQPEGTNPDPPRPVRLLELHVTHVCNLTCESCSHYSNHGHNGHTAVEDADRWMGLWRDRLDVAQFDLLGGEPTVHPQLPAFVSLVRKHWPKALIRVLTNGFFLHRHPDLPSLMAADGNATIRLSIHHDAPEYRERLQPILDLVKSWQAEFGTHVDTVESHRHWTRRYQGYGDSMRPFADGDARKSWEICPAKYCKQLYLGRLWKCAPLAYLGLQRDKYELSPEWDRYLRYEPLDPGSSLSDLDQFLAQEEEQVCAMCPAERRPFALPVPMRTAAPRTVLPGGRDGQ